MKISEITNFFESIAPIALQEDYDNSGLLLGNKGDTINKALITLDVTEEIIDEAIEKKFQMIISHHPVIFQGLKKINGNNLTEKILIKAIKNDIAIYAAHTNLDNIDKGVNSILCSKIGLQKTRILKPKNDMLRKLITFCPTINADKVRNAIFEAGAGHIGNYDSCSFNTEGKGSFRALENANPFVGKTNDLHFETEIKIEAIYPVFHERNIISALKKAHPYEEVAYDIFPLANDYTSVGSGMIGILKNEVDDLSFLKEIKKTLNIPCIKHSQLSGKKIQKVAVCGGSGGFLIHDAIAAGADIFMTGDIKYHDFQKADDNFIIADIGHFESEQFSKELIYAILNKKFPKFALQISKTNTNPVNYL